ncbi:MAG TPA: PH domain-containing protein [Stenotrophomonas sp.]
MSADPTATTAEPAPTPPSDADLRLHPLSWLFVLLQQVKQFIVPLVALVVFGQRGDGNGYDRYGHLVTLGVIVVLVGAALLQYLTYRYRVGPEGLHIRSGWLHRSRRDIPYARIHNVVVHQSLLHRLFGVAELRLESAGGQRPEAEMRVLRLDRALALEQRVRQRSTEPTHLDDATLEATPDAPTVPLARTLLALPTAEVIRLGLVSNRGMVVVAAGAGVLYQMFPERTVSNFISNNGELAFHYVQGLHPGLWAAALAAVMLALAALIALRALSVVLALVQYHSFRLSESERRLTVERGLLTRVRTSAARRRIQAWTLQETFLHRLLARRRLRVDTAASDMRGDQGRALRELAPIAPPAACDALIEDLLPGIEWPPQQWSGVRQGQGWRLALPSLWLLPVAAFLAWRFTPWAYLLLLWLPWSLLLAYRQVSRMGYTLDDRRIVIRGGWWDRWWRMAELDKLQALRLSHSPLDRLCGTASLWLDTAGATGTAPALRLRLIDATQAQTLYDRLAHRIARRQLQW